MKGIKIKPKIILLSLLLFMALLLPLTTIAQNKVSGGGLLGMGALSSEMEYSSRGGLFDPTEKGGYNLYNQHFGSEENGGYELYNQTFGQELPLGSGLLILTAAGAFYALKKRKSNMK